MTRAMINFISRLELVKFVYQPYLSVGKADDSFFSQTRGRIYQGEFTRKFSKGSLAILFWGEGDEGSIIGVERSEQFTNLVQKMFGKVFSPPLDDFNHCADHVQTSIVS